MLDGIRYKVKPELGPGQASPWQMGKIPVFNCAESKHNQAYLCNINLFFCEDTASENKGQSQSLKYIMCI